MTDGQLNVAIRPGVLDGRALDRLRPDGRMVDNLAAFRDDELAKIAPYLDDEQMLRLTVKADRRDLGARAHNVLAELFPRGRLAAAVRAR